MISDWVAKYTHTTLCTHEQCKSSDNNQVILAHVGVVYMYLHLKLVMSQYLR